MVAARRLPGGGAWVSSRSLFFSKNPIGFQRTNRVSKKSCFQGISRAGRFVRSVFMVGLFGRLSQGLLRGEDEFDGRAAAKVALVITQMTPGIRGH